MPDEFEDAERAFWKELSEGRPADVRGILENQFDLVQDAVILGTLLNCFFFVNGKVGVGRVSLKALPSSLPIGYLF